MSKDEARGILQAVLKGIEINGAFHIQNPNRAVIEALKVAIEALKE